MAKLLGNSMRTPSFSTRTAVGHVKHYHNEVNPAGSQDLAICCVELCNDIVSKEILHFNAACRMPCLWSCAMQDSIVELLGWLIKGLQKLAPLEYRL